MNMWQASALAAVAALTILGVTERGFAEPSEDLKRLRKEVEALQEGQKAIQSDLQEIKNLLRARPAAAAPTQPTTISVHGAPFKGDKNAKVTLVEFTDYECPYCGRYVRETYTQIERDYIRTGKLKYVIRDLPLESMHPLALKAAEATHCAGEQAKYWEMHDRLFANQRELTRPDLSRHAQALGLDAVAFDECMDTGRSANRIRKDVAEAQRLQTTGTPTFYLGLTDPSGPQIKAIRIVGAQPYQAFKDAIERLLSSEK